MVHILQMYIPCITLPCPAWIRPDAQSPLCTYLVHSCFQSRSPYCLPAGTDTVYQTFLDAYISVIVNLHSITLQGAVVCRRKLCLPRSFPSYAAFFRFLPAGTDTVCRTVLDTYIAIIGNLHSMTYTNAAYDENSALSNPLKEHENAFFCKGEIWYLHICSQQSAIHTS